MLVAAHKLWLAAAVATVIAQVYLGGDWQHLTWATVLPIIGLVIISGSILAAGKARAVAMSLTLIGVMPLVLLSAKGGLDTYGVTQVPSVTGAVQEVLAYGFNGRTPSCMEPRPGSRAQREERSLGSPSRDVTVAINGLYFGSIELILLTAIATVARAIPAGFGRKVWLTLSPLSAVALDG